MSGNAINLRIVIPCECSLLSLELRAIDARMKYREGEASRLVDQLFWISRKLRCLEHKGTTLPHYQNHLESAGRKQLNFVY